MNLIKNNVDFFKISFKLLILLLIVKMSNKVDILAFLDSKFAKIDSQKKHKKKNESKQ